MELYLVLVALSALVAAPTLYFCAKDIPNADDEYKKRINEEYYFNVYVKPKLDAKVDSLVEIFWKDIASGIADAYRHRPMIYSHQPKEWYLKIPASYYLKNNIAMFNEYQRKKFIEDVFQKIGKGYWFGKLKSLTYGNKKGPVYFIAVIEHKEINYSLNIAYHYVNIKCFILGIKDTVMTLSFLRF